MNKSVFSLCLHVVISLCVSFCRNRCVCACVCVSCSCIIVRTILTFPPCEDFFSLVLNSPKGARETFLLNYLGYN